MKQDTPELYQLEAGSDQTSLDSEHIRLKSLWAAVLTWAIRDIVTYVRKHELEDLCEIPRASNVIDLDARSAARWINSTNRNPGGFEWVCSVFDWCPVVVRSRIVRKFYNDDIESLQRIF